MNEEKFMKRLDIAIRVGGFLLAVLGTALVILLFKLFSISANAQVPQIVTRIPFEEMVEHAHDKAFEEYEEEHDEGITYLIDVTDSDIDLMARVVMSEASTLCSDAKQGIAATIVNRVRDSEYEFRNQNTVESVVYYANAYSTQSNGTPDASCYQAVYAALTYGEAFPEDMFYFREDRYHDFAFKYEHIGSTYFSTYTERR